MCYEAFAEIVKLSVEKLKEDSVYQILQNDIDYQSKSREEGVAEQRYIELDLTKHQRMGCNQLLDCRDSQNLDYSTCSYMAGLYDAFRILAVLFTEKWDIEKLQKSLFCKVKK